MKYIALAILQWLAAAWGSALLLHWAPIPNGVVWWGPPYLITLIVFWAASLFFMAYLICNGLDALEKT